MCGVCVCGFLFVCFLVFFFVLFFGLFRMADSPLWLGLDVTLWNGSLSQGWVLLTAAVLCQFVVLLSRWNVHQVFSCSSLYCYRIGLDACMESVWLFWFWLKEQAKGTEGRGQLPVLLSHRHSLHADSKVWSSGWRLPLPVSPGAPLPRQQRSYHLKTCHTGSIFIWALGSHFPRSISRKSSGMSCNAFLRCLSVWFSPEWGFWHRPFLQGLTRARHTAARAMPAAQE